MPEDDAPLLAEEIRLRLGSSFALGAGHGLLHLGTAEIGRILPPAWAWWRDFAARYVTALCATPEGGEVRMAVRVQPHGIEIVVEDTGRGIPSQSLPHIFDRFYRVPGSGTAPGPEQGWACD